MHGKAKGRIHQEQILLLSNFIPSWARLRCIVCSHIGFFKNAFSHHNRAIFNAHLEAT